MSIRMDHVAFRAYDIDRTVAFYTQALGLRHTYDWHHPELVGRAAFLSTDDGGVVEVFDRTSTVPGSPQTPLGDPTEAPSDEERAERQALVHFGLRVEDVDGVYARALEAGGREALEPTTITWTGNGSSPTVEARVAFVIGLDGEVIELVDHPDLPAAR